MVASSKQFAILLLLGGLASAQTIHSKTTVRHHKVQETTDATSPLVTQAEANIAKGNLASAEDLLKKAVTERPDDYQAWFDLGFVYNATGHTDDSIAAYRKSVAAKPDIFESNLNLGLMLVRTRHPDAEQYLRAATKLKPSAKPAEGLERAWLSLGHLLADKKPEDAIAAFEQASQLQPKDADPLLSAGQVYEQLNKFAEALDKYRQALEVDPRSSDALVGLVNIYIRGQRYEEAEPLLRRYVDADPSDPAAHIQLGRLLAHAEKYDAAAAELQKGLDLAPGNPAAARELASLYSAQKKYGLAETQYRVVLKNVPGDPQLHREFANVLLHQQKPADAQEELLLAIKLKPDVGDTYGELAVAAAENKNYPLALKALDARARFLPENPVTYFLRATTFDNLHDYKQAAQYYHLFLDHAQGQFPDQEFQARHRLIAIEPKK